MSETSTFSRRNSMVAVPTWIFWFGQSRVRSAMGWPLTWVPFEEPRSSMSAWS